MAEVSDEARRWWNRYKPPFSILETQHLINYFNELCREVGIDPDTLDFAEEVMDWSLTYWENRKQIEDFVRKASGLPRDYTGEILNQVDRLLEGTEYEVVESKTLEKLERAAGRLEKLRALESKAKHEVDQLKRKVETLMKELEEQKAYRADLEVKYQELSRQRTVVSDEEYHRRLEEFDKRARELKLWSEELTRMQFEAKSEIPPEEFNRMLRRITKPKPLPRIEIWKPPEEEAPPEGPPEEIPPAVELPKTPLSTLPFPRSPSSEERALLWTAFHQSLTAMGVDSYRFLPAFRERIEAFPFRNWDEVIRQFEELIHDVLIGKPVTWLRVPPMPWREDEKRYDAIIHFTATKIYKSMEDLLDGLGQWGIEGVTPEEAKEAIKHAWKEKNVWFTSVSKDFLEALMEQKID